MPLRVLIMITLNRSSKPFLKTSAARALPTTWRIKTIACMVTKKLAAVIEKTKNKSLDRASLKREGKIRFRRRTLCKRK